MPEENINPPATEQASSPEQPMMTFSELEKLAEQETAARPQEDKGEQLIGGQQPQEAPGQAEDPTAKALAESGFKSLDELVKSRKEAHATITKLTQEKSAMQRDLEALSQFPELVLRQMGQQQTQQQSPPPAQGQAPDSLTEELFKDMAPFVDRLVEQRASQIVDNKLAMKELGSRVQAKRSENVEEFDELRPIMLNILEKNPHYEAHPQGLNMVYDMAKNVRDQRIAKITSKIFGDDIPVDKIREAIKMVMGQPGQAKEQTPSVAPTQQQMQPSAYVPPTGANTPPMSQRNTDYDKEIKTLMKAERISRDTPDKVLDLWWEKVNSQATNQANLRR